MRVSESRYNRDLRRINLAQRMIKHEVRTQWICAWAGISDERVRNLVKSYDQNRAGAARHRGPCPKAFTPLVRTSAMRSEASGLGGLACALNLIPPAPIQNARKVLPGVELGERLISAFELYKTILPSARLKMDQFILLVLRLAEGELEVGHCNRCHAAVLLDPLSSARRLCEVCKRLASGQAADAEAHAIPGVDSEGRPSTSSRSAQQDLFGPAGGGARAAPRH